jgi:hypothetical protein
VEGQEVEFALEDVEHLLRFLVQVCPDIEARCHVGLEDRPHRRLLGARLQGHGLNPAAGTGRQQQSIGHFRLASH